MNKPISMVIIESKKELVNTINKMELHPTILAMVLKETLAEVEAQARYAAEQEAYAYAQACAEEAAKEENAEPQSQH